MAAASWARKAASPSRSKMTAGGAPASASMAASRSMNSAWWACATRRPTALLPLPGRPMRTSSIAAPSVVAARAGLGFGAGCGAAVAAAARAWKRARLSRTSASESPPVFSSMKRVRVSSTIASPMTPAAGTTLMSLRS